MDRKLLQLECLDKPWRNLQRGSGFFRWQDTYAIHSLNPLALTSSNAVRTEVEVYPGKEPPPFEEYPYQLWLAFVCAKEWTDASGKVKPPTMTLDLSEFYNPSFFCNYRWTSDSQASWKRALLLKMDGRFLHRDIRNNGSLVYVSLPPPFQDGYLLGRGLWYEVTNIAGVSFPTRYQFTYFVPAAEAVSEQDLTAMYSFWFEVTNAFGVRGQPVPIGLGSVQSLALVSDHRFESEGYATVKYAITNGTTDFRSKGMPSQIKSKLAMVPKRSFEEEALLRLGFTPPQKAPSANTRRNLFRVFLGCVAALPVAVMWLASRRGKNKTINQH